MIKEEIWKPIFEWENIYEVSNLGRVKRVAESNRPIGILKTDNKEKYLRVTLNYKGKQETRSVHSLVLEAFVCLRPEGMVANHRDGKKHNNVLENLEWVTPSENTQHAFDVLHRDTPRGESHGMAKLNRNSVEEIRRLYETGKYSQWMLSDLFKVGRTNIQKIVRRQIWRDNEI